MDQAKKKEEVKNKLQLQKRVESLDLPALQVASDYYTEQEMIKFKKPKKKVCSRLNHIFKRFTVITHNIS